MSRFQWINQSSVWRIKYFLDWEETVFAAKVVSNTLWRMILSNFLSQRSISGESWERMVKCTFDFVKNWCSEWLFCYLLSKSIRVFFSSAPRAFYLTFKYLFAQFCLEVGLKFSMRGWSVSNQEMSPGAENVPCLYFGKFCPQHRFLVFLEYKLYIDSNIMALI